jgi:tol-pal system protein YbgF
MAAFLVAIALFATDVFAAAPVVSLDQLQEQQNAVVHSQQVPQQNSRDQLIAEQQIQITALQEEIRQLRGMLEEQDYKTSQLLERQRELYRDLDQRLSDIANKSSAPVNVNPAANAASNGANAEVPAVTPNVTPVASVDKPKTPRIDPAKAAAKLAEEEQAAYDAIFPLVRNKQYVEATKAYQDFLQAYPTGKNAANARYWLGQIFNVQNQLEDADTQFKLVVTQFPESAKAHEALLKLGEIAKKRGLNDSAKGFFQKVLQQYPDSPSARVAQQKLQELK